MNDTILKQAQQIKSQHISGDLTSAQYFAKMASFGKKYNLSVFKIETELNKLTGEAQQITRPQNVRRNEVKQISELP